MALSTTQKALLGILERVAAGQYLNAAEVQQAESAYPGIMGTVQNVLNGGGNAISAKLAELRAEQTGAPVQSMFGGAVSTPYVSPATTAALQPAASSPGFDAFFKAADVPGVTASSATAAFNAATQGVKAPVSAPAASVVAPPAVSDSEDAAEQLRLQRINERLGNVTGPTMTTSTQPVWQGLEIPSKPQQQSIVRANVVAPEGGGGQGTGGAAGTTARRQWGYAEGGGAGEIEVLKTKYPGFIDALMEYPFLEKLYKEALRTNDFSRYDSAIATIDTKWKASLSPEEGTSAPGLPVVPPTAEEPPVGGTPPPAGAQVRVLSEREKQNLRMRGFTPDDVSGAEAAFKEGDSAYTAFVRLVDERMKAGATETKPNLYAQYMDEFGRSGYSLADAKLLANAKIYGGSAFTTVKAMVDKRRADALKRPLQDDERGVDSPPGDATVNGLTEADKQQLRLRGYTELEIGSLDVAKRAGGSTYTTTYAAYEAKKRPRGDAQADDKPLPLGQEQPPQGSGIIRPEWGPTADDPGELARLQGNWPSLTAKDLSDLRKLHGRPGYEALLRTLLRQRAVEAGADLSGGDVPPTSAIAKYSAEQMWGGAQNSTAQQFFMLLADQDWAATIATNPTAVASKYNQFAADLGVPSKERDAVWNAARKGPAAVKEFPQVGDASNPDLIGEHPPQRGAGYEEGAFGSATRVERSMRPLAEGTTFTTLAGAQADAEQPSAEWATELARLNNLYPGELAPEDNALLQDWFVNDPAKYQQWLAGFTRVADQRKTRPVEGPPGVGVPGGPASLGDMGQPPTDTGTGTDGTVPATGVMASFFQAIDQLEAEGEVSRELWNKLTPEEQATLRTAPGFKLAYATTIPPGDLGTAAPPEGTVAPPEPGSREAAALKELETRLTGSGYSSEESNSIIAGFQTGGYEGYFQALDRVDVARRNSPETLKAVRTALQEQINTLTQSMKFDADKYLTTQTAATEARYAEASVRLGRQFGIDPGGTKTGKAQQQFELLEASRVQELNKLQNDVTDKLLDFQQKTLTNFTNTFQTLAGAELNMTQLTETVRQFNETLALDLKKYNLSEQEVTAGIAKINADILNSTRQTSAVIGQQWAEVLGFAGTESGTVSAAELGIVVSATDKVLPFLPASSARRSAIKASFAAMMGREPTNAEINTISTGKSVTVEGKPTLKARELAATVTQQDMERTSKYAAIAGQLNLDTNKFTQAQTESDRQWNLSIGEVAETVGFAAADATRFQTAKYGLDSQINALFFDSSKSAAEKTAAATKLIETAASNFAHGNAALKAQFLQANTLFDRAFGDKQNQIARGLGVDAETWATAQRQTQTTEDRQLSVWGSLLANVTPSVITTTAESISLPYFTTLVAGVNGAIGDMALGMTPSQIQNASPEALVNAIFERATADQLEQLRVAFETYTPELLYPGNYLRRTLTAYLKSSKDNFSGFSLMGITRSWITTLSDETRTALLSMVSATSSAERQSGSLLGSLGRAVGIAGGALIGSAIPGIGTAAGAAMGAAATSSLP